MLMTTLHLEINEADVYEPNIIMKVKKLDKVFFGAGISILVFTFSRLLGRTLSEATALERKVVRDFLFSVNDHCKSV